MLPSAGGVKFHALFLQQNSQNYFVCQGLKLNYILQAVHPLNFLHSGSKLTPGVR